MPKFIPAPINLGGLVETTFSKPQASMSVIVVGSEPIAGGGTSGGRPSRGGGGSSSGTKLTIQTDEQVVLDSYARLIYPGSLIKGNSVSNLDFNPIVGYQKLPVTVSVSIAGIQGVVSKTIADPNLSTSRTALNEILSQNISGDQINSLSYELMKFSTYDELKLSFGANVKIRTVFSAAFKDSTTKISLKTGLTAKFIQRNFTVDMDIPTNGQLLANNVSPSSLGSYSPVYVSSITYGRLGIIAIESNYEYNDVYTAFSATLNFLKAGGGVNITSDQKKIIEESQMTIYLRGGQGGEAVKTVKGFDEFVNYIVSGGKFSVNSPGVPLFFSLNYLSDHTLFKTLFNVIQLDGNVVSPVSPPVEVNRRPRPGGGDGGGGNPPRSGRG